MDAPILPLWSFEIPLDWFGEVVEDKPAPSPFKVWNPDDKLSLMRIGFMEDAHE